MRQLLSYTLAAGQNATLPGVPVALVEGAYQGIANILYETGMPVEVVLIPIGAYIPIGFTFVAALSLGPYQTVALYGRFET